MMKVCDTLEALESADAPVQLAIGFFDGVHRGHRAVIQPAIDQARSSNGSAWVLTFEKHPATLLHPEQAPLLITSNKRKARLLEEMGVDGCIFLPFTKELAARSPAEFIALLRQHCPELSGIHVGANWRFGHMGQGDTDMLRELLQESPIHPSVMQSVSDQTDIISSTLIRDVVRSGELDRAATLLGSRFAISGTVIAGDQVGRTLGFPTANIRPDHSLLPPNGVYAATVQLNGQPHEAVLNIGFRPTVTGASDGEPHLEVHILDSNQDLYEQHLTVTLVTYLRQEQRFADTDELARQISIDVDRAREALAGA